MPVSIPLLTSETNYVLHCPIDDQTILFDVRWNSRDAAWYIDIYEDDDTVIALNVKVVLGIELGRRSQHEFFWDHTITAVDTTGLGLDPGFDDLNAGIKLVVHSNSDLT